MIDKRILDYTNLTDKDAFYLWMNECPVKEEFTDAFEDDNDRCEFYFFRIPKELGTLYTRCKVKERGKNAYRL